MTGIIQSQIAHTGRRLIYMAAQTDQWTPVATATLFTAANILCQCDSPEFTPTTAMVKRDKVAGPSLQPIAGIPGASTAKVKFSHPFFTAGTSGVAITAPSWALAAKAASHDVVVNDTGATVGYTPADSVSIRKNPNNVTYVTVGFGILTQDGTVEVRWAVSGARSNMTFKSGKPGEPFVLEHELEGALMYEAVSGTYAIAPNPIDNTPASAIVFPDSGLTAVRFGLAQSASGIFTRQFSAISLDAGNKLEVTPDVVGPAFAGYAVVVSEAPTLTVDPMIVAPGTANDVSTLAAGTVQASSVVFGTVAGQTLEIDCRAQYTGLSMKAVGARAGWEAKCDLVATDKTTNDAYTLIIK